MNIYVSASLFALLVLIYLVISEIFTILFRFVGLPEEKARFQVTSLLTCCGFTTRESEMLLTTKPRRRLARITMLFGYVFNVTFVSAIINVFLSLKESQVSGFILGLAIPLLIAFGLILILRIPGLRRRVDRLLEKLVGRVLKGTAANTVMLIDHIGKGTIAQVTLNTVPEVIAGTELRDTGLKEKRNILVMLVENAKGEIEAPSAHTVFREGDKLTVFGDYKTICRVFHAKERFV